MIINMKKLSKEAKVKLIYSGELMLFAILFLVFGILKLTGKIGYNDTRRIIFNWITLAGAAWGITDFVWAICSKKRQQRISLIDKILLLPLIIFMVTYDMLCLVGHKANETFCGLMLGIAFLYISVIYIFQSIYHFYKPIPGLLDDLDEEERKEENSQEK